MQIRNIEYSLPKSHMPTFSLLREPFILGNRGPSPYHSPILAILLPISHLFEGSEGQEDQFWPMKPKVKPAEFEGGASSLWEEIMIIIIQTYKIFVPASRFLLATLSVRMWYLELWPPSWDHEEKNRENIEKREGKKLDSVEHCCEEILRPPISPVE